MGGGYHDDSRNYFPKSQGLSAEPPATGGAAAPFLLFQVLAFIVFAQLATGSIGGRR